MRIARFIGKKLKSYLPMALLALIAGGLVVFAFVLNNLPSPEQFETRQVAQSTKIFDWTGKVLLYEIHGEEKRTSVPYEEIPESVKKATISIEDKDFYNHAGFSIPSIINGAIIEPLTGKSDRSRGGSTITQQLAKNAFLSSERTLIRKVKELIVAYELEKRYTKDEILNLYLNQIPYGNNAYGIEAAAQTYFNKHASELNLAESAVLASLPKATSYYSRGNHTAELMARKDLVLQKMNEYGYISEKEMEQAQKTKIEFAPQATNLKAPHFVLEVQDYLNKKYGEDYVQTAGLNVITTLDWDLQQIAEKTVLEGANRNKELYDGNNAALMAQDATTGQILAMVGSKDYFASPEPENCTPSKDCKFEGNFNVVTQGLRQPGSAIKPFAYAAAFEKGLTPDTVVFDTETEFDATGIPENSYKPGNYSGRFKGPVTLREALSQSLNIPAVKVLYIAGIDNMLRLAKDFGITSLTERSRYGLSLVLGGGEVTLKDIVGAYTVFAQEGIKHSQTMILSIKDSKGTVVEEFKDSPVKVIEPQYTRLINDILSDIDARAELFFSSSLALTIFPGHEVALKTGTTNDYRDAWTIGYTPDLVVGVWTGNNDNEPLIKNGSSVLAAMPIWSAFMKEALKNRPLISFNKPDPFASQRPMFDGEYIVNYKIGNQNYPQIHDLLFYIDKKDPTGPQPLQPENDSQFKNWEDPVLQWAQMYVPNFIQIYNRQIPIGAQTESMTVSTADIPVINLTAPKNGEFIKSSTQVSADITSSTDISRIQLLFNNELMDNRVGLLGKNINYQFTLIPKNPLPQNSLKIKITDNQNWEVMKEVIVYK